ncbi:MAG: 3-demethoxyubiquinol 3-hydroxylase [Pseudomonadota bacterium]|nr:3-demethoxyubiquinol 3-hydroxylase [Pseudomonadota bacterium]
MRHYSLLDKFINQADYALRTLLDTPRITGRTYPATHVGDHLLTEQEKRHAGNLMRVNHAGEVSAQALYQGQALTARLDNVRANMEHAALEENDHLVWTAKRLKELRSHKSLLNPFWYAGSFATGALTGMIGDKWSLGFVAETEFQVVHHLDHHIQQLPANDARSIAILQQMKQDESHHATTALKAGGTSLPLPVKRLMTVMSKVLTASAYYL